jgi:hypothetical protein
MAQMIQSVASNNTDIAKMWNETQSKKGPVGAVRDMSDGGSGMTANNTRAANWGSNYDASVLPDWARAPMAQSIMYSRQYFAANGFAMLGE